MWERNTHTYEQISTMTLPMIPSSPATTLTSPKIWKNLYGHQAEPFFVFLGSFKHEFNLKLFQFLIKIYTLLTGSQDCTESDHIQYDLSYLILIWFCWVGGFLFVACDGCLIDVFYVLPFSLHYIIYTYHDIMIC